MVLLFLCCCFTVSKNIMFLRRDIGGGGNIMPDCNLLIKKGDLDGVKKFISKHDCKDKDLFLIWVCKYN